MFIGYEKKEIKKPTCRKEGVRPELPFVEVWPRPTIQSCESLLHRFSPLEKKRGRPLEDTRGDGVAVLVLLPKNVNVQGDTVRYQLSVFYQYRKMTHNNKNTAEAPFNANTLSQRW